jgi:hypothetical protein
MERGSGTPLSHPGPMGPRVAYTPAVIDRPFDRTIRRPGAPQTSWNGDCLETAHDTVSEPDDTRPGSAKGLS